MELIFQPFILIYHMVSKVLSLPTLLLRKTNEEIEDARMNRSKEKSTITSAQNESMNSQVVNNNFAGIQSKASQKEVKPLSSYRYTLLNTNNKKVNGVFEAESEADVKSFYEGQGYQVLDVKLRKPYDIDIGGNGKIKAGALAFALTQLSTYIKAGIPLVEAVQIL